jgi:hypothetical protein
MKHESLSFASIGARAANYAGEACGDCFQDIVRRGNQQKVTLDEPAHRHCRRVVRLSQRCRTPTN